MAQSYFKITSEAYYSPLISLPSPLFGIPLVLHVTRRSYRPQVATMYKSVSSVKLLDRCLPGPLYVLS